MSVLKEFKAFAVQGNVADMAVGIIIGASFGKIVSSLVADILMPPIGMIIGGVNFTGLSVVLKEAEGTAAAVTLNYGTFLQTIFDFSIVAFAMFMLVKGITALKKQDAAAPSNPPPPSSEVVLLSEIRDLLKTR